MALVLQGSATTTDEIVFWSLLPSVVGQFKCKGTEALI
jgi:hypothetical protein